MGAGEGEGVHLGVSEGCVCVCVCVLRSVVYHIWQSRVEIESYSIAYFDRVAAFKAPYLRTSVKGEAQTRCVIASIVAAFTQHV